MKESGKQNKIWERIAFITAVAGLIGYGISCVYLYYMQSIHMEGQYFESDLPYHINMALDGWGYSLTAWVYRILSLFPFCNVWIAVFLALSTIAAVALTFYYYKKKGENTAASAGAAFICAFAMPFFIRSIHYQRYIGYQSPSIWHNSTYIVMKPLALASLLLYFFIADKYGKEKCSKSSIAFALLLALCTATKTSFIFVFAPAALCFLIADLAVGISWKKVLLSALTVIPSVFVILWQEVVLFGEDTGNSIIIDFGYTVYQRAEKPYFTMILSALFPVLVFLFNGIPVFADTIKDLKKREGILTHREFLIAWTMWFFGAAELLFLRESGARENDANFSWGYDFALFVLFIISIRYFIQNLRDRKFLFGKKWLKTIYASVMMAILSYHVYCGVYFFIELLSGTTYFM